MAGGPLARVASARKWALVAAVVLVGLALLSPPGAAVSSIADGGFESGFLGGPDLPPMDLSFGLWTRRDDNSQPVNAPVHGGQWTAVVDTMGSSIGSFVIQDFDGGDASYRWTFWVYPDAGIEGASLSYNWDRGVTGAKQIGSAVGFRSTATSLVAWDAVATDLPPVTFGTWHEVTVAANRCARTQDLFIDGQPWGSLQPSAGLVLPSGVVTVAFGDGNFNALHGRYYWDDFAFEPFTCGNACPASQGYWKTHGSMWPVSSLTLGTASYDRSALLALLRAPTRGDSSLILARQLIAAKLNVANGVDPGPVAGPIADADAALVAYPGLLPYAVKPSTTAGRMMTSVAALLDEYNTGGMTPGCEPSPSAGPKMPGLLGSASASGRVLER